MEPLERITVEVPMALLEKARLASGLGVTATVRLGLELVASPGAARRLRELRGRLPPSLTATQLRDDR